MHCSHCTAASALQPLHCSHCSTPCGAAQPNHVPRHPLHSNPTPLLAAVSTCVPHPVPSHLIPSHPIPPQPFPSQHPGAPDGKKVTEARYNGKPLPHRIQEAARRLCTTRNRIVHEVGFNTIPSRAVFVVDTDQMLVELRNMVRGTTGGYAYMQLGGVGGSRFRSPPRRQRSPYRNAPEQRRRS